MRGKKRRVIRIVLTVFSVVFAVGFLLPTVLTVTNSFMSQTEISASYGAVFGGDSESYISDTVHLKLIPDLVSLSQYITVLFRSPEYLLKFWNSVILVVPIVVFQAGVAAFAAYSFSRYRGRFREILLFAYIILMLMPYQVTLVPNYLMSNWLNILDTNWSIWLPGIVSPFSVFLLTKFMRRVPVSYVEAAKLEGANEWQIFSRIYLPMCKGILYSVAILVFLDYWNMVEQPIILLSDMEKYPLSVYLSKINSEEVGVAFAVAVIYMIPPLLLFLHGEKQLIEGIGQSEGIKG